MAISYYGVDEKKDYVLSSYRTHTIDENKILLVNDYGSWVVLDKKEYGSVNSYSCAPGTLVLLEQKGIVLTKRTLWKSIKEHRRNLGFLFRGPSLHIVVPTSRCNHNCVYCFSKSKKRSDMDEATAKKVVEFIFQTTSPSVKIEFQGGEPLLNFPIVRFVVDYAKEVNKGFNKKLDFALSTNLTLMHDEILDFLIENEVSITASLDGPKRLHDKNRPSLDSQSSYDEVAKWMRIIQEKTKIESIPVTTKHSLQYPKEIVDEYLKLGLNLVWIQPLRKIGNAAKNWGSIGYSADEFFEFWRQALEYILELNQRGTKVKEISATILLKKILKASCINFCEMQSPCGGIISQLAYDEKGYVYVCDDARQNPMFRLGNVKRDGYEEIVTSEKAQSFIAASMNENLLCDSCVWKPYCGVCPVCNYSEQGNIIPKLSLLDRCKINKKMFDYVFRKILTDEKAKNTFLEWVKTPGIV